MIVWSLVHVLSISGYHMAVVAGIVFFVVRALLALIPGFAGRHPIRNGLQPWRLIPGSPCRSPIYGLSLALRLGSV